MDASLFLVDNTNFTDTEHERAIVYTYAFGALDAIAQKHGYSKEITVIAAGQFFMQYFGLSPEETGRVTRLCMEWTQHDEHCSFVREGGQAILEWSANRDESAPIRLLELLKQHGTKRDV
jgi:hypothetical protein